MFSGQKKVTVMNSFFLEFANSFPDTRSAIAALPQTVLMLPETAWKNLKIINKKILLDKLHKKLKRLKDNKDKKINFYIKYLLVYWKVWM